MTGAIVTINLPGDPRKNNDQMMRAVTEDASVETIRKAVTAMMKKPSDFQIGHKVPDRLGRRKKHSVPVISGDEDVEAAFT